MAKKDKKEEVEIPKEEKVFAYAVAAGKSLTTRKGIIGPGQEIKAEHVSGGMDTIEKFVKSGHIVKG